jgi:hypothetical protein
MELFWCSHCGGSLPSKEVSSCSHCGVGLADVKEGDWEAYQTAQKKFAQWQKEQFRKKLSRISEKIYPILKPCFVVIIILVVYAAITYGLFRGFLYTSRHFCVSHLVFRAVFSAIILELTILLSLFFYNKYLGDPFYWIITDLRWREGKYWRDSFRNLPNSPKVQAANARTQKRCGFGHSREDKTYQLLCDYAIKKANRLIFAIVFVCAIGVVLVIMANLL